MMHGAEKSDPVIVAGKPANKAEQPPCGAICGGAKRSGAGGAKGGDQGECGPAKQVPDAEPGKPVTGAGTHTASRSGRSPVNSSFMVANKIVSSIPKYAWAIRLRTAAIVAQGMSGLAVLSSWGRCQRPRP